MIMIFVVFYLYIQLYNWLCKCNDNFCLIQDSFIKFVLWNYKLKV